MPLATTTSGVGPRLALVHGFTQNRSSWASVSAGFEADHEVVAVDLPGHGDSSHLRAGLWQCGEMLTASVGRATYLGYSMGARVCLHAALRSPNCVQRLIVLGANPGLENPADQASRRGDDEHWAEMLERQGLEAFLDAWLAQPMFDGVPDDRAGRLRNTAAGLASSIRMTGLGAQEPLWPRLGQLQMPVLVLAGERDEKFNILGHRLAATIGDNARFVSVPGAGHAAHLEQQAVFMRIVRRWMLETPIDESACVG